jgi:hypothetical protein
MIKQLIHKLKENPYQYFLAKIATLFITVALLDLAIGSLINLLYFRQKSGMLYRTTYAMEKTTADVIIIGSSAARHNYDPQLFQRALNMPCFNAGMDGNSIFYNYAVLKCMLKRYSPKVVICDFGATEFRKDPGDYDQLSVLLPYYKTHPEIRAIVDLKSPYEKVKMLSRIYPFNSLFASILMANSEYKKETRTDIEGYVPIARVWNESMKDGATFVNCDPDSNKIILYQSFIRDCIKSKLKLYIVCSPLFIKPNYENHSVQLGQSLARENNVSFFDFSRDSAILGNPGLFADISHLNQKGSTLFTNRVIDSIVKVAGKP